MPPATDGSQNSNLGGGPDCVWHIAHLCAARYKPRRASYHAIPNGARVFVTAVAGSQQITFESPAERGVNLFAGFDHVAASSQKCKQGTLLQSVAPPALEVQQRDNAKRNRTVETGRFNPSTITVIA